MASTKGTYLFFFVTQIGHSAHAQQLWSWRASLLIWPSKTTAISKAVKVWLPWEAQDEAMPVTCLLPWGQLVQGRRVKRRRVWSFSFPHKELRVHWSIRKTNPAFIPSMHNFPGQPPGSVASPKAKGLIPCCCKHALWKVLPIYTPQNLFFPNSFWYLIACVSPRLMFAFQTWVVLWLTPCVTSSLVLGKSSSSSGNVCHHERRHSH